MAPPSVTGLLLFISDIRSCASAEAEEARISRELAKIKSRLSSSNKKIKGYERKKCVLKLLYCHLLGYNVEFGHMDIITLISSSSYSEKNAGYLCSSVILNNNPEILRLCVNTMEIDIMSSNEHISALALHNFSFVVNSEMAESFLSNFRLLAAKKGAKREYITKKIYMCVLKILRKDNSFVDADTWRPFLIEDLTYLLNSELQLAVTNLILGFLEVDTTDWEVITNTIINLLNRMLGGIKDEFCYYGVPCPWLFIRLYRILQFLPVPSSEDQKETINTHICNIFNKYPTQIQLPAQRNDRKSKRAILSILNKGNAEYAVLFEAINLAIHYSNILPVETKTIEAHKLGTMLIMKEPNVRYLALDAMARLSYDSSTAASLQQYVQQILLQLNSSVDVSIKRQALNLLYVLCNSKNWLNIVNELMNVLKVSDECIQEELALKIAILAENNAPSLKWYIDFVFKLIEYAPKYVADDIWYRVIQVVIGFDEVSSSSDLQGYAAKTSFNYLNVSYIHEPLLKLGSYLIGEFGHLITDEISAREQFNVLHRNFHLMPSNTKAMLFVAYAKIANSSPEMAEEIINTIEEYDDSADVDLQTRACELSVILRMDNAKEILAMMPCFSVKAQLNNPLTRRLKQTTKSRAHTRSKLEELAKTEGNLLKPSADLVVNHENGIDGSDLVEKVEEDDQSSEGSDDYDKSEDDEDDEAEEDENDEDDESDDEDIKKRNKLDFLTGDNGVTTGNVSESKSFNHSKSVNLLTFQNREVLRLPNFIVSASVELKDNVLNYTLKLKNLEQNRSLLLQSILFEVCSGLNLISNNSNTSIKLQINAEESLIYYLECFAPFIQPTNLRLVGSFVDEAKNLHEAVDLNLKLPIYLHDFLTSARLSFDALMKYWNNTMLSQRGFRAGGKLALNKTEMLNLIENKFNFKILKMEGKIYGSAVLHLVKYDNAGNNSKTNVPCMLEITFAETGGLSTLIVRSAGTAISQVLCKSIATHIMIPNVLYRQDGPNEALL